MASNMSVDTFNDMCDAAKAGPNDEVSFSFTNNSGITGQAISTDPAVLDMHQSGSPETQSSNSTLWYPDDAPEGWTYRQMLEIVAFPPPEGRHLWHAKVSQLAADLGMPSGSTGKDIVNFVLRVASRKKELHRVMPLVKALAAAARVLEGRIVAPTTLLPVVRAYLAKKGEKDREGHDAEAVDNAQPA